MWKKFAESKNFNIMLAILIAVGLWFYVTSFVTEETSSVTINNIAVELTGVDVLQAKGFMIDPNSPLNINLKVSGGRTSLVAISGNPNEYISASVDVSGITETGSYDLPVKIQLKNFNTSGIVAIDDADSKSVNVVVSKLKEDIYMVDVDFAGTVAEGYRMEAPQVIPNVLRVQGPEDQIQLIHGVEIIVTGNQLTESVSGQLPYHFVDADGNRVYPTNITADYDTVYVIFPVVKTVDVPLSVEFLYGGGITAENFDQYVSVSIEPENIQISGAEIDISHLVNGTLRLGQVDLASVDGSRLYQLPIILDSSLTNDSGITEAAVTVRVQGLETKTVETSNIEIINTPSGVDASAITRNLQVKLRGPSDAIEAIEGYQLRAVADLQDEDLSFSSQITVPVRIYFDGHNDCGIITGDRGYSIIVDIH